MPIVITSTTDTAEAVTQALGDGPKAEKVEGVKESAAEQQPAETTETSDSSDSEQLEAKKEENPDGDLDESSEEESQKEDQPAPKKKGGFKKRIDKLTSRLSQKEQEAEYWKAEALKQKQTPVDAKPIEVKAEDGAKPKADEFESHEAYIEALTDWKVEQKDKARELRQKEVETKTSVQRQIEAHVERVKEFSKTHDDFEELMEDVNDIPMPITLQQVILDSDNGPELMYELAKNRDEYERICKLPAIACARELGRFEARLKREAQDSKPIKKTKAPPPIQPVGSKGSSATMKAPEDMDYQEYKRWREAQIYR